MIKKTFSFIKARFKKSLLEEKWLDDYREMGMKIGVMCRIQPEVTFDYSHCWLIEIGNYVIIAPQAYLLAHDTSTKPLIGYSKVGKIIIEDGVFIGARALIMPNVRIGKNSIVAAGSVITKSVPEGVVVGGNPAKVIMTVAEYTEKINKIKDISPTYEAEYTIKGNITDEKKVQMSKDLIDSVGFVI
jgi:maltose O-acetyltransferase